MTKPGRHSRTAVVNDDAVIPLLSKALKEVEDEDEDNNSLLQLSSTFSLPNLTSSTDSTSDESITHDLHGREHAGLGNDEDTSVLMSMASMSDWTDMSAAILLPTSNVKHQSATTDTARSTTSFDEESAIYTHYSNTQPSLKSPNDTSFERSTIYSNDDTWLSLNNNNNNNNALLHCKRLGGHQDGGTRAIPDTRSHIVVIGIGKQPCGRDRGGIDRDNVNNGTRSHIEQGARRHSFWKHLFGCLSKAVPVCHEHTPTKQNNPNVVSNGFFPSDRSIVAIPTRPQDEWIWI